MFLWNVRGLNSSIGFLDASPPGTDLLLLTETWVHKDADPPTLPGYHCFGLSRPMQGTGRPAGGVACYVKQHLVKYASHWKSAHDGSHIWVKIDRLIGLSSDLYLCLAYFCPEHSTFYRYEHATEPFDNLTLCIAEAQAQGGDVLLAGDLNARTGTMQDFVTKDQHADIPDLGLPSIEDLPAAVPTRQTLDREAPNNFGKQLIAMCQDTSMLILNGRVEGDASGQLTCQTYNGSSLVDYFIASPSLFAAHPHLHVEQLPPDSDHCPLNLSIPLTPVPAHSTSVDANLRKLPHPKYQLSKVNTFRIVLANTITSRMHYDSAQPSDCQATAITECITTAAARVHGFRSVNAQVHRNQPWYDDELKSMRRRWHALSTHSTEYEQVRKEYKRAVQRKQRQFQLQCQQQLCQDACNNAVAFWRSYKKKTSIHGEISPEEWRSSFQVLFGPDVGPECPSRVQGHQGESPELNIPISHEEVTMAFGRLKRHKASGIDGIKSEYLLDAQDILLEPLTASFNQILSHGIPQSWCSGVIHPIFKSGSVNDPNNYRGITVTSVLAKLFTMVLEARMSTWAEGHDLRAEGQAGFRKDYRTTDNVFIMQALIANARKAKKKIYCCFVDFKKAFDCVPRQRLWEVLASLGIQGDILACLQSIYDQDEACVLTQAGLTEAFRCTAGVKQGCPASPLLFGLYIDELEALLKAEDNHIDAPKLFQTLMSILLFADDIALMSYSQIGLQNQLSVLGKFCTDRGLHVNVSKTKIVVFEPRRSECCSFMFDGQEIERVEVFKYLGIAFHATRGLSCAMEYLCNSARKALFALHKRCHELHIVCPALQSTLFDTLIRPILSYCCEIWVILGGKVAMQKLEQVHTQFLRQLLGVPTNTATKLIYAECGKLPLKHSWLQQSLKYLARMQRLDDSRLCKIAFQADMQLGLRWFAGLKDELRQHDIRMPRSLAEFCLTTTSRALKDSYIRQGMTAEPSSHLQCTYFSLKTEFRWEPYITQAKNRQVRSTLARFRTGWHWLQVCLGRRCQEDYDQRRCPSCPNSVEDEHHAIFNCRTYTSQRLIYEDLFENASNLRSFLVSNPPHRVAEFLTDCHNVRLFGQLDVDLDSIMSLDHDEYDSPESP